MTGQVNTLQPANRMNAVPHYEEAIASLQGRRDLVLQLMDKVLVKGTHYGEIPGCGNKPSLFLPGAEQLAATFGYAPRYKKTLTREGQHLSVDMTCELYLPDGTFVCEGISMCSTYESKYRYRAGAGESTGEEVPKAYWDKKKSDPKGAQEMIGGPGFTTSKLDDNGVPTKGPGKWFIMKVVEKCENPDLADQHNTVVKMAAKRALVHAVRTATGTADVFTQDIEDFRDSYGSVIDAEVVDATTSTGIPTQPKEHVERGWTIAAQGEFSDLLDTQLYKLFKEAGHLDRFSAEQDKWKDRKSRLEASEVIAGLKKWIGELTEAIEKKKANPEPPKPQASPTPAATPEPVSSEQSGPVVGSPEYGDLAKSKLNAAGDRFIRAYTAQKLENPTQLAMDMRNKVMKDLVFNGDVHLDTKKIMLAEALQKKADQLKIPA